LVQLKNGFYNDISLGIAEYVIVYNKNRNLLEIWNLNKMKMDNWIKSL